MSIVLLQILKQYVSSLLFDLKQNSNSDICNVCRCQEFVQKQFTIEYLNASCFWYTLFLLLCCQTKLVVISNFFLFIFVLCIAYTFFRNINCDLLLQTRFIVKSVYLQFWLNILHLK